MNPKLQSTLYLILMSALVIDGAIAQPARTANEWGPMRAKFADDYNAGKFGNVIADAAALEKLNALDAPSATVTAQAYYKKGDYPGCVKYIQEHFYVPKPNNVLRGDKPPAIAQLLDRCQKS